MLHPSLIYAAAKEAIQSSWVEEIKAGECEVFVSSSPTGWSNNNVGLAWLEQVFDSYMKQQSERWQLLILDGHGSLYCGLQERWRRHVIASSKKSLRRSIYNTRKLRQLAYIRRRGGRSLRQLRQSMQQEQQLSWWGRERRLVRLLIKPHKPQLVELNNDSNKLKNLPKEARGDP
jgi:hypothetical protein